MGSRVRVPPGSPIFVGVFVRARIPRPARRRESTVGGTGLRSSQLTPFSQFWGRLPILIVGHVLPSRFRLRPNLHRRPPKLGRAAVGRRGFADVDGASDHRHVSERERAGAPGPRTFPAGTSPAISLPDKQREVSGVRPGSLLAFVPSNRNIARAFSVWAEGGHGLRLEICRQRNRDRGQR